MPVPPQPPITPGSVVFHGPPPRTFTRWQAYTVLSVEGDGPDAQVTLISAHLGDLARVTLAHQVQQGTAPAGRDLVTARRADVTVLLPAPGERGTRPYAEARRAPGPAPRAARGMRVTLTRQARTQVRPVAAQLAAHGTTDPLGQWRVTCVDVDVLTGRARLTPLGRARLTQRQCPLPAPPVDAWAPALRARLNTLPAHSAAASALAGEIEQRRAEVLARQARAGWWYLGRRGGTLIPQWVPDGPPLRLPAPVHA